MPQAALRVDNTPICYENEILCDVETLNIDSASFKQISDAEGDDPEKIAAHITRIIAQCGKQHNPVTGSGGMFIGCVREIGSALQDSIALRPGDRIASLVSLTLTPLHLDAIERIDITTGRVWVKAQAVLFSRSLWAKLPTDIDENVALAVLDVAGAPTQVKRLCQPGQTVVIIGADGKSGILSCAQAKARVGPMGHVIGIVPSLETLSAKLLLEHGYVDELICADARNALVCSDAVLAAYPDGADLTINCVNVPGTELASILMTKDQGTLYFFSMSTSFTAAALGAEGVAKDITMIVGNGYAVDHAEIALQTLRDHTPIRHYFELKYASK